MPPLSQHTLNIPKLCSPQHSVDEFVRGFDRVSALNIFQNEEVEPDTVPNKVCSEKSLVQEILPKKFGVRRFFRTHFLPFVVEKTLRGDWLTSSPKYEQ